MNNFKTNKLTIILAALLPLQFFVYSFFLFKPSFVDGFYFPYIFSALSNCLNYCVGLFNFALLDVMILTLIVIVLVLVYKSFKWYGSIKTRYKRSLEYINPDNLISLLIKDLYKKLPSKILKLLAITSILYGMFVWMWGFNYYRTPLEKSLNYNTQNIEIYELDEITRKYVGLANKYREKLNENQQGVMQLPNLSEWILKSKTSFDSNAVYFENYPKYKIWQKNSPVVVKELYFSSVLSALATSGIYNVFTTEANVNIAQPDPMIPLVTCHEIAHQIGFAPENEANFIGFVAARENSDVYYKYSAALFATRYLISAVYRDDRVRALILRDNYSDAVLRDIKGINLYWSQTQTKFQDLSRDLYDYYLKFNSQKAGRKSYGRVVRLIVGEERELKKAHLNK